MKSLLLGLCVLSTILAVTSAQADERAAKIQNYTATFTIHYPSNRLCSNCYLNFATSIDWTGYLPENGLSTTFRAYQVAPDTFSATASFNSLNVGSTYVATVYYSAWSSNATDRQWLNTNCRNVLNNKSGSNKGREFSFTLPSANASFDLYPNFCYNEGAVRTFQLYSNQLNLTKTIYYYVPGSLLDNPLPRPMNYLLQSDGFAIQDSLKTTYDFAISQGLMPETIVFGIGQGLDTDPWIDGGAERSFEYGPYKCFVAPGGPPGCSPRTGGGFLYLDFMINNVLPQVQATLGMPAVSRDLMAISGWSLGGLDACVFGYVNASIFSKAYCGSGSFYYNGNVFASIVNASAPSNPLKIYIDIGGREHPFLTTFAPGAYQALLARPEFVLGKNLMYANYSNGPDSHQFNSWTAHTPLALAFLYNEPSDIAWSITPIAKQVKYSEATRPFSVGTAFKIPLYPSSAQKNGAIPDQ